MPFSPRTLGRTGLLVSPLGLATGGGSLPAAGVELAFERGLTTFYWGSYRAAAFGRGVARLARARREALQLVVQSYTRAASLMRGSLERALRALGTDHTDVLLLGWWNRPPPRRILDAALALRERGLARHLMISCHDRTTFPTYARDPAYGAIMVRYNAAHPGAETEVFPSLGDAATRPGVVAYTATRWGHLLDPAMVPADEPHPTSADCYRFALTHPSVDLAMCAPRDIAELELALTAVERGPLSEDELAWMKRVGAHVKRAAAGARTWNPVDALDRAMSWLSPGPASGADIRRD